MECIGEFIPNLTFVEILWALLALLVVLVVWRVVRKFKPRNVVAYSTESGRVMVSRAAIVELVRTSCSQIDAISKPSVKIRTRGRVTHFDVRIKLAGGGHMREVERTLQNHLRRALTENLGIENLGRIDITATGFKSGKIESSIPKVKPADRAAEDEADDPVQDAAEEDAAESAEAPEGPDAEKRRPDGQA